MVADRLLLVVTPEPADHPSISVVVGITVGLLASFIQSLGLTIQRKSHLLNDALPEESRKLEYRRPLWILGFAIFILSNILGSVVQIAALPVVILAPLGAVSLLWNAFFARLLLGDVFSRYMLLGTILIAGGAVLIAIFGLVPEPTHSLDDLLALFARDVFIVYFSLLGFVLFVVLAVSHFLEYRWLRDDNQLTVSPRSDAEDLPNHTEPINETTALLQRKTPKETMSVANSVAVRMWLAISYASASGILSGMCLLFAKSSVELLVLTITGKNQFRRWESWALMIGLITFALLQLWYLHKSLILADPTLVCPLAFCFYNLSSIFNGLVYYDQFGALTRLQLLLVLLGIVILMAGVWAVSLESSGVGRVEVGTWQEGAEVAEVLTAEATGGPNVVITADTRSSIRSPSLIQDPEGHATGQEQLISPPWSSFHERSPSSSTRFPLSPTLLRQEPDYGKLGRHIRRRWPSLLDSQGGHGGLSIGIGVTSPGFALVPRRRVSSVTLESPQPRMPRRTVSDVGGGQTWRQRLEREDGERVETGAGRRLWGWLKSAFKPG